MTKKIAIIGTGIAGLACAYELQKAGLDVTVYEKENYVGGRMSSRKKDSLIFDIGADHLCNIYDHMKKYCQELDIEWQPTESIEYGLYKDGKIQNHCKGLSVWSRMKLFFFFLFRKRTDIDFFDLSKFKELDTENAYDYMKRKVGTEIADYLVDPFATTYQFHRAKEITCAALLSIMNNICTERHRWHLQRTKGGMSALPNALAERLNVKLSMPVQKVEKGTVTTQESKETYDAVVIATTSDVTKKILSCPTEPQKTLLNNTKHSSTISVSFEIDKDSVPHVFIVWVPYKESTTISGYVNEKMKGEQSIHNNSTLICTWLHEDFAKSIMGNSDEEIFEAVKKELLKVCPWFSRESDLENYDLQRWKYAMPKFEKGQITRVVNFLEKGQGDNNIFLCGDYLNSPWTEGALRCGQRVAKTVLAQI